jgi:hypothetical protein
LLFLSDFIATWIFSTDFPNKKNSNIKFNENPFREAELFHADRRTDRHDEANNRFSLLFKRAKNPFVLEMTSQIDFGVLPAINFIVF